MDLADLSVAKRAEVILLALDWALQDLTAPATTRELVAVIMRRLSSKNADLISRTLVRHADKIPEAARGAPFTKYGKSMRPVIWYPKGQRGDGRGLTRRAKRNLEAALTDEEIFDAYCKEHGVDPETGLKKPEPENWSV